MTTPPDTYDCLLCQDAARLDEAQARQHLLDDHKITWERLDWHTGPDDDEAVAWLGETPWLIRSAACTS